MSIGSLAPSGVNENQAYFISEVPISTSISDVDSVPMAFSDCANDSMLEYLPSGETSRMRGLPDTCRMVAPAPMRSTAKSIIGKLNAMTGSMAPNRNSISPMTSIFFLPIFDCHTPVGTDSTPNIIIPENDTKEAMRGVMLNAFSTTETSCPAASPKPIARKTKNTDTSERDFFINILF